MHVELESKADAEPADSNGVAGRGDAGGGGGEVEAGRGLGDGGEGAGVGEENPDDLIKIRLVTWNVGNAKPNFEELVHTLNTESLSDTDLVVIGTQENHFKGEKHGLTRKKASVSKMMVVDSVHSDDESKTLSPSPRKIVALI